MHCECGKYFLTNRYQLNFLKVFKKLELRPKLFKKQSFMKIQTFLSLSHSAAFLKTICMWYQRYCQEQYKNHEKCQTSTTPRKKWRLSREKNRFYLLVDPTLPKLWFFRQYKENTCKRKKAQNVKGLEENQLKEKIAKNVFFEKT